MKPLAIIEAFNKCENLSTRFVPGVIRVVMDEFILQRAEEALRHRVIITVALPTHTRCDPQGRELLL